MPACAVRVEWRGFHIRTSWITFIAWTTTLFGVLWSSYLWVISRQAQLTPRSFVIGSSSLDVGTSASHSASGQAIDPFMFKIGQVVKVGAVAPPCPRRESVRSLALFAAVLAFLPAWKQLSGASSFPTLLGPVALAVFTFFVGLTVQMVRLPVLWCDRCKFLALIKAEGLYA